MCKTMVMKMSLATMLLMLISMNGFSQNIGVKSNLLYWATTTPNIGLETSVGKKHTAQVFVGFNPWKQSGGDQSSLRHWLVMPEYRYWFCQNFNGWFLGAHAMGGQFNAGGVKLPFGMFKDLTIAMRDGTLVVVSPLVISGHFPSTGIWKHPLALATTTSSTTSLSVEIVGRR